MALLEGGVLVAHEVGNLGLAFLDLMLCILHALVERRQVALSLHKRQNTQQTPATVN